MRHLAKHLSSDEINDYLIGDRTPEQQQHVRECAACRNEVERLERPLAWFGGAVRQWSDRQTEPGSEFSRRADSSLNRGSRWRSLRLPSAVAATVLFAVAAVPIYRGLQPARVVESPENTVQDSALLEQVQAGLARTVPQPLEPLSNPMKWEEGRRKSQ